MSFKDNYTIRKDSDGVEIAIPKVEFRDKLQQQYFDARFKKTGLPEKIKNYSIDSYVGKDSSKNISKLKKFIEKFKDKYNGSSLYFYSNGHSYQKTTIASWIGRELCINFNVCFVLMNNLVEDLTQKKFDEDKELKCFIYENCDLLIVDDSFVRERVTLYKSNYQLPFLDAFLRNRLEVNKKATIFTSNVSIIDIAKEGFGLPIQELVKRNVYEMQFKDSILLKEDFNPEEMWK